MDRCERQKSIRRRSPAPPFITSTLQQEASRKLGFQARRTMKTRPGALWRASSIAGHGTVGLITYMRTDSLRISDEAAAEAQELIRSRYSKEYLPASRRVYKSRSGAQDAHEAIRPTMPRLTPEEAKGSLTSEQYKLYKLIWSRFIASQMANALLDTMSVDITAGEYTFRASGYHVKFDGFTVLYEEGRDEEGEKSTALPPLEAGQILTLLKVDGNQHFTQPPARYTEASLIKSLEENGIGRPSTYAPTISTILDRGYVERNQKQLVAHRAGRDGQPAAQGAVQEDRGRQVHRRHGKRPRPGRGGGNQLGRYPQPVLRRLHGYPRQGREGDGGVRVKVPDEETDIVCELCGRKMVIKSGRFGKFWPARVTPSVKTPRRSSRRRAVSARSAAARSSPRSPSGDAASTGVRTTPTAPLSPGISRCPTAARSAVRPSSRRQDATAGYTVSKRDAATSGLPNPRRRRKTKHEGDGYWRGPCRL